MHAAYIAARSLRRMLASEVSGSALLSAFCPETTVAGGLQVARARVDVQQQALGWVLRRTGGRAAGATVAWRGDVEANDPAWWSGARRYSRTVDTEGANPFADTIDGAAASAAAETSSSSAAAETLSLTPAAVEKIKELQRRRGSSNVGLRLIVSGGGCSGFQYEFEISDGEDAGRDTDRGGVVVDVDGAKLFCDELSMGFVKGSTIDYERDMIQSKFVVRENPNAELGCGCGSSFSVAF